MDQMGVIIVKRIKVGRYVVDIDVNQTKSFYEKYHVITEDCSCSYCTNYEMACETFSPALKNLFHLLGIDPRKEGEISEYRVNEDGTHLYGALYHIVGEIIEDAQLCSPISSENEVSLTYPEEIEMQFSEILDLVPEGFPQPTVQFEIQLNVPWLVSE